MINHDESLKFGCTLLLDMLRCWFSKALSQDLFLQRPIAVAWCLVQMVVSIVMGVRLYRCMVYFMENPSIMDEN